MTGSSSSYLDGPIEIAGKKADFILANENGISVNGAGFINTNGVTLTTGKVNNNNGNLSVDVTKGNISIEKGGVETSGNYFNVISQTIELYGQVSAREGENDANLTFIAGNNRVNLNNKANPEIIEATQGEITDKRYGIYAGPLGAMYGNNIRLISTAHGLGVRHEGIIRSKGDISIEADGDIAIGGLNSEKNIDIKGKGNLETLDGTYQVNGKTYNYSITSTKGIKLNVTGDMDIRTFISANGTEGLAITANNLKILGDKKTTAGILAQGELIVKVTGDITIDVLMRPVKKDYTQNDPPLVLITDANGNIVVKDPITGKVLGEGEYSWVGTGIQGERIDISSNTFTNNSTITNTRYLLDKSSIKIDAKERLTNNNLIYSSGTLTLNSKNIENKKGASLQGADINITTENITNSGEIRQNVAKQGETANRLGKVKIDFKNGIFTNEGTVSGYTVEINGEGFNLINTKEGKIIASTLDYPAGQGTITIKVKDLKTEGIIQSYGAGTRNDINISVDTLSNILGYIIAQKGNVTITSTGNITNSGEIFADKDVNITSTTGKEINNNGGSASIGAGQNVTITAKNAELKNSGKIYAAQKLLVMVSDLINVGDSEGIKKYLEAFYNLGQDGSKEIDDIINELTKKLESTTSSTDKKLLEDKIKLFNELKDQLKEFNDSLETLPGIGSMSANTIEISTEKGTQNNGIVKANQDIKITSKDKINNTGILEAGTDVTLKAEGDIVNSQRIYAGNKIDITGKSFEATGSNDLLIKYATILDGFTKLGGDSKLEELNKEIDNLQQTLKAASTTELANELKAKIDKLVEERNKLGDLKAQIASLVEKQSNGKDGTGLSTIESKNVSITTTGGALKNAGLIVTTDDLTLNAGETTGNITNTGNIAVGKNATITGNSFKNSTMTVGGKLTATLQDKLESESLKIAKDMEVTAKSAQFTNLDVGENANIALQGTGASDVTFGKENTSSKVNVTGNLNISGGGLVNKAETAVTGNLDVKKNSNNNAKFENTNSLAVKGTGNIDTGNFNNTAKLVVEKDLTVDSAAFSNSGSIIGTSNATINSTSFNNTKDISVKNKLTVDSTDFVNNGANAKIIVSDFDLKAGGVITNQGNIEATGSLNIDGKKSLNNPGKILVEGSGKINITNSITNSGNIKVGKSTTTTQANGELKSGDLSITTGNFTNNNAGNVTAENDLTIKVTKEFTNNNGGNISGGNVLIDGTSTSLNQNFTNGGSITSAGTLKVDLGTNQKDINLSTSGTMASKDTLTLITGGNISNAGKFSNEGGLTFNAGGTIINTGMLASLNDINLTANGDVTNGVDNGEGFTIWSNKKISITSKTGNINNYRKSSIISKGDMSLTAERGTLLNKGGKISSGGELNINVKRLKNEAIVDENSYKISMVSIKDTEFTTLINADYWGNKSYNYDRSDIYIWFPKIEYGKKQDAVIEGQGDLNINVQEEVYNLAGRVSSEQNLNITGVAGTEAKIVNKSFEKEIDILTYLKYTRVVVEETINGNKKILHNGSIYDAYFKTTSNGKTQHLLEYSPFIDIMRDLVNSGNGSGNIQLMKDLYDFLQKAGANLDKNGVSNPDYLPKKDITKTFYSADSVAEILAGKNIKLEHVKIENGEKNIKKNTTVNVTIGDESVETVDVNLGVTVTDPNSVTEVDGIKYPNGVEVITGSVTINGVTIDASTGGLVSAIAVAGTINPISYIEIPEGNNGLFRPADPRPGQNIQYKFETNLDFIDPSKYFGSEYFFDKIGYDPNKTSTVIGDAYYETELINKVIKDALGYTGEVTADYIKTMLDSAAETKDDLGLVVGKPLTPDQINNLEKDIIWYVEVDMDGEKVLVPQVYFGKETRIEMAQGDKGGGYGSTIKAGGNIDIKGGSVSNTNANIVAGGDINMDVTGDITNSAVGGFQGGIAAGGNIDIKAGGDLDMIGGTITSTDGGVSVETEGNINIESTLGGNLGNQTISNKAGITAKGDVTVKSEGDTTIKNGTINSSEGDVALSGKNVNIEDQNLISSGQSFDSDRISKTESSYTASTSVGSEIGGKNVTINADNDVNITGSTVAAEKDTTITAGNDVNIKDGTDHYYEETKTTTNGFDMNYKLNIGSSNSKLEATTSVGSVVGGGEGLTINSGNDVNIKGSTVVGGEKGVNITAEKDVNITDGQNTVKGESHSQSYDVISFQKKDSKFETTTSVGSGIVSGGDINITAKEGNVTSVGTEMAATGDTNITAKGDVKFEAGKNTHTEESSSIGIGIMSGTASAGIAGYNAQASWTPTGGGTASVEDGNASDQTIDEMNKFGKGGKNYMDSLTNVGTEIGISIKNESKKSTTWTEGNIKSGGNINITSEETTDIGGVNLGAGKDINIAAKDVETTKYVDEHEEKSSNIGISIKVDNMTTSAIADAVNKGMQIHESATGQDGGVNGALTAAQVAGTATNVVFGDLISNTTAVTGNISYGTSHTKTTEENTTTIDAGGNVNIKATEGDINLKGVDVKAEDGVSLDAAENVNIEAAKKTEYEKTTGINASAGFTTSAGVAAIDGGNVQIGATATGSYSETNKNNTTYTGSSIDAGGKITISSGKDTNVVGSTVTGNEVDLDVGGDLNIITKTDDIDQSRKEGWGGADISGGLATNTIGTGDLGISGGGGNIWQSGDKITGQAGITAKKEINVDVKGDANLVGGVLGSETGEGNMKVGGDLNVTDVKSNYEEGGAIIGVNAGTEGGGILGEVGDRVDLEQTAKGTINIGNVTVDGDVTLNGDKSDLDSINKDLENSITTEKDEKENGGTFSGTASALPTKKKSSGSYDFPDGGPVPPKNPDPIKVKVGEVPKPKVEHAEITELPKPQRAEISEVPKPEKAKVSKPEIQDPKYPDPIKGKIEKTPVPKVEKAKSEDLPKPDYAEPIPQPPIKGVVVKDGWIKTEHGWIQSQKGPQGAVTTQGPFNKKGLDGFRDGIESLGKGKIENGPGVNQAVKKSQNTDNGDVFVEPKVENGPGVNQATKKTQGGDEGDVFVEPKVENGPGVNQATKKTQGEDEGDVFVDGVVKNGPGTNQAVKKSQGPDPDPTKGEVVKDGWVKTDTGWQQDGWVKTDTGWQQTTKGQQGAITTQGPFTKKGLDGFRDGVDSLGKGKIENGPGVNQATKKTQGGDEGDVFVDPKVENGPG